MNEWTDLPDWVWPLLDALVDYEDEHPVLYRMNSGAEYERWPCIGSFLEERQAWPPREIRDAAEFRRHVAATAVRAHYRNGLLSPKPAPCRCELAYLGAQAAGTPIRCERCHGLVDTVAQERLEAAHTESRRTLEAWAEEHATTPPTPPPAAAVRAESEESA